MELTEEWALENRPAALPLPSVQTFQRGVRQIPPEVVCYAREGPRRWWAKYSPYISRQYDEIASNDIWVGDTYTMDIAPPRYNTKSGSTDCGTAFLCRPVAA